ncbi:MAG: hypothetical protein ABH805_02015 [Candidatus Nealsonbacteria bacterium]
MKKKILFVLVLLILIFSRTSGATTAQAADPPTSTTTIKLISETEALTIANPFVIKQGAVSVNVPESGKIYPGDKIAEIPLTISNVGNISYLINFSAQPAEATEGYPNFDLKIIEGDVAYFPWEIVIAPKTTKSIKIEIYVSYGSYLASFKGLNLRIWPSPDTNQLKKG